jgi:hypothetical protein
MTRVLILGNSHTVALKDAEAMIKADHPDVELSFFSVSEPNFSKGRMDKSGVYAPRYQSEAENDKLLTINGAISVDLTAYDHVLVVGLRFPLQSICDVLDLYDVLEGSPNGKDAFVSSSFLQKLCQDLAKTTVSKWMALLGADFSGAIYAAPFPSIAVNETEQRVDRRARASRALNQHPEAGLLFEMINQALADAMSQFPARYLFAPDATVHSPFLSKAEFSETDHVHMNGRYGQAIFSKFFNQVLEG